MIILLITLSLFPFSLLAETYGQGTYNYSQRHPMRSAPTYPRARRYYRAESFEPQPEDIGFRSYATKLRPELRSKNKLSR